jgi:hypothetical protein
VADQLIQALLGLEDGLLDVRVTALTSALSAALSENSACEEVLALQFCKTFSDLNT